MSAEIHLRFYEELNDYLPPEKRKRNFAYSFEETINVGQMLNSLGVPCSEVELVLVNGSSVDLWCSLKSGDRVSLFPVFESFDVKPLLRIRDEPLRKTRFIADPRLRRLALYLRFLGFDATVRSLTQEGEEDRRIVLTTDAALLPFSLPRVYIVRKMKPREQLQEILSRFDLGDPARFSTAQLWFARLLGCC